MNPRDQLRLELGWLPQQVNRNDDVGALARGVAGGLVKLGDPNELAAVQMAERRAQEEFAKDDAFGWLRSDGTLDALARQRALDSISGAKEAAQVRAMLEKAGVDETTTNDAVRVIRRARDAVNRYRRGEGRRR